VDLLKNFRTSFREILGLDTFGYLTLARAAFQGMLRFSRVSIELVTDQRLYEDIESGLRGGLSVPFQPY
jgi:hypothetical protein